MNEIIHLLPTYASEIIVILTASTLILVAISTVWKKVIRPIRNWIKAKGERLEAIWNLNNFQFTSNHGESAMDKLDLIAPLHEGQADLRQGQADIKRIVDHRTEALERDILTLREEITELKRTALAKSEAREVKIPVDLEPHSGQAVLPRQIVTLEKENIDD